MMESFFNQVAAATRRHGFNPVVGDIQMKQQQWYNWYRGDVNGFHLFTRRINGKAKKFERQTLNMPKKICEDYATLIWNEQCEITVKNKDTQKLIHDVLKRNNFETQFVNLLESSFGMGMSYMVEYLADNQTEIDFIKFDNALPLAHNNGKVTALATVNPFTVHYKEKELTITHLTYHYIDKEDMYCVMHEAFVADNQQTLGTRNNQMLSYIFNDGDLDNMREAIRDEQGNLEDIIYKVKYDVQRPFFQVIRPNITNHYDSNSAYGVGVISTLIPSFKIVDTLWDMLQSEAEDNKTRIIIDHQILQTTMVENEETGDFEFIKYYDETDTTLLGLPLNSKLNGQKPIEFMQGTMRMEQIDLALNRALQITGFRAGLGRNYYNFQSGAVYQNEANVIHSNADTWKSKKKHEVIIEEAIKELVVSILHLERQIGNYNGNPDEEEISVTFDDSIVQDDATEFETVKRLSDDGYLPKWYAVAKALKIPEDEAKLLVEQANAEDQQAALEFLGGLEEEPEEDEEENEPVS